MGLAPVGTAIEERNEPEKIIGGRNTACLLRDRANSEGLDREGNDSDLDSFD
jgi:hypothetical protein